MEAQVAQELAFGPEDLAADGRVDPVGADQQIGLDRAAVAEGDGDTVGAVVDAGEGGGVAYLDAAGDVVAQRAFEVGAHDAGQLTVHDLGELGEAHARAPHGPWWSR